MENKAHRGRFRAQGGGVEESESWNQDQPLNKSQALHLLTRLKARLPEKKRDEREKAFQQAEKYIQQAEGGIDAQKLKSFYSDKKDRRIRVELEILSGRAFVTIIFLLILLAAWLTH